MTDTAQAVAPAGASAATVGLATITAAGMDPELLERGVVFDCAGDPLLGIVHPAIARARLGVMLVVGGPQYRIGAHRQYVLLARALAAAGIPAFRFDYRGMGDSDGELRTFEEIADDLAAAAATFVADCGVAELVLWGLCDGASAIAFYAAGDARVRGVVLANPWVRTEEIHAAAAVSGHYRRQIADPRTWWRAVTGRVRLGGAAKAVAAAVRTRVARRLPGFVAGPEAHSLSDRVLSDLCRYSGPVLLILSGADGAAAEFEIATRTRRPYRRWLASPQVTIERLPGADHAFSTTAWRDQVIAATLRWVSALDRGR